MKRREGIIFVVILLVGFCGIGYWLFYKHNVPQLPSAFAQAPSPIFSVHYVDDGHLLLTQGYDGKIALWDAISKKQVGQFHCNDRYLKISNDGRQLLFIANNAKQMKSVLSFVQLPPGKSTFSDLQHQVDTNTWRVDGIFLDISPDFSRLIVEDASNQLSLLDAKTRKVLSRNQLGKKLNYLLNFSRDGLFIFSTKDPISKEPDQQIIYNASDLTVYRVFPKIDKVFIPDNGKYIFGTRLNASSANRAAEKSSLTIFNLAGHNQIQIKTPFHFIYYVTQRPDETIAVEGMQGDVSQHNVVDTVINYSTQGKIINQVNADFVEAYSNDFQWMLGNFHFKNSTKYVMDTEDGNVIHRLNVTTDPVGNQDFSDVFNPYLSAISPDKSQIACANLDGLIRFYDFPHRGQSALYESRSGGHVVKSFDAQTFVDYDVSADGTVSIHRNIRMYQGKPDKTKQADTVTRNGHIFSYLKTVTSPQHTKQLIFWQHNTELEKKAKITSVPDPTHDFWILIDLSDVRKNTPIKELSRSIYRFSTDPGIAWSNDETLVALSDMNGNIYVWNTRDGERAAYCSGAQISHMPGNIIIPPTFHDSPALAISPHKDFIAVGRTDGTIYLYSLKTWLPVAQLGNAPNQVTDIKFSPDEHTLYGVTNHEVRSWDVPALQP
jgi:WD40 repeat protein